MPARSVCTHGDTPGAVGLARAVRARLEAAGVTITAVRRPGAVTAGDAASGLPSSVLPAGDEGLLLEVADLDAVLALEAALRAAVATGGRPWREVTDVVPAARTVLLLTGARDRPDGPARGRARGWRRRARSERGPGCGGAPDPAARRTRSRSPVRYDGPDLDDVARLTGLTPAEVVAAHTGTPWRVAFGGFAPGSPTSSGATRGCGCRAATARARRCPPGRSAWPASSPGSTRAPPPAAGSCSAPPRLTLWDVDRDPPALLGAGHHGAVRRRRGRRREPRPRGARHRPPRPRPGRRAARAWPPSGSVAPAPPTARSHRLGARLVGHPADRAALEVLLGGLAVRARGRVTVALTGAPAPATVDGRPVAHAALVDAARRRVLTLGMPSAACAPTSPSAVASTCRRCSARGRRDTLSGLGPPPVAVGDVLPVGDAGRPFPTVDHAAHPAGQPRRPDRARRAAPAPGPPGSAGWGTDLGGSCSALDRVVGADSDRVGLRLSGSPVHRARAPGATPSCPARAWCAARSRCPPGGEPVVFLADHPVTGGYPVVGGAHGIRLRPRGPAAPRATPVRLVAARR